MGNCLVAQSGGPTAVINASLAGIIRSNQLNPIYENVLGGLYGIEGVLEEMFYDLTNISSYEIDILKQTPSSALGTCRYKLKRDNDSDYERLFSVLNKYNIDTMFYIGGNDSMDTVDALADFANRHGFKQRFIGIPKTVDNDLVPPDHSPGFPSAAKLANMIVKATRLDYDAYTRPEVFILETMGRDAGWLAASCCLSGVVDLLVLPEVNFYPDKFIEACTKKMDDTGACYIVCSEGAKFKDGTYLSAGGAKNDGFSHAVLGGAALSIKQMLLDANIAPRVVVQDLSRAARSSNFAQSKIDVTEAYELAASAHMMSIDESFTGMVVGVKRTYDKNENYNGVYFADVASKFANHVKNFPSEWILDSYLGVTKDALDYFRPLVAGEVDIIYGNDGTPLTIKPYNLR